jgi:hypothetical protein
MRQLIDEPKAVYEVGAIREKGRATARQCSRTQKLVARCSGEGWSFYKLWVWISVRLALFVGHGFVGFLR